VTGYSTREVSEVLGLPTSTILSWTRAGLLTPLRGPRGAYYFSFQDIALLRTARDLLDADVSSRRIKRTLETLRGALPGGRPLSAVHMVAQGDRVLIRDGERVWDADSGQLVIDLESSSDDSDPEGATAAQADLGAADDWYDAAVDLEREAPDRAKAAYLRALTLDPGHSEAHLNLGRLLHEAGDVAEAETHYRIALQTDPSSARAFYNLGVALEDQGRGPAAAEAYEAALRLNPELAVAHFNLSRLCETAGRQTDALAHLAAYKRILERGGLGP